MKRFKCKNNYLSVCKVSNIFPFTSFIALYSIGHCLLHITYDNQPVSIDAAFPRVVYTNIPYNNLSGENISVKEYTDNIVCRVDDMT